MKFTKATVIFLGDDNVLILANDEAKDVWHMEISIEELQRLTSMDCRLTEALETTYPASSWSKAI